MSVSYINKGTVSISCSKRKTSNLKPRFLRFSLSFCFEFLQENSVKIGNTPQIIPVQFASFHFSFLCLDEELYYLRKEAKIFSNYMKDKKDMSDAELPSNSAGQVLIPFPPLKMYLCFLACSACNKNCSYLSSILNSSTVVAVFEGPYINVFLEKFWILYEITVFICISLWVSHHYYLSSQIVLPFK